MQREAVDNPGIQVWPRPVVATGRLMAQPRQGTAFRTRGCAAHPQERNAGLWQHACGREIPRRSLHPGGSATRRREQERALGDDAVLSRHPPPEGSGYPAIASRHAREIHRESESVSSTGAGNRSGLMPWPPCACGFATRQDRGVAASACARCAGSLRRVADGSGVLPQKELSRPPSHHTGRWKSSGRERSPDYRWGMDVRVWFPSCICADADFSGPIGMVSRGHPPGDGGRSG
jgi:hypothetical protein